MTSVGVRMARLEYLIDASETQLMVRLDHWRRVAMIAVVPMAVDSVSRVVVVALDERR